MFLSAITDGWEVRPFFSALNQRNGNHAPKKALLNMPRDGAIIFGDLIGKFDMIRIESSKCGRSGRYRLADLITRYGHDAKLVAFTGDVTENCARRQARNEQRPCGAMCPDLPKVV